MFACEEIPVTIEAGQSVAVSLALEGLAQPPGNLRAFFQVIRIHDDVLQGGFTFQQGSEYGNHQDIADTYCYAFDDVHLTVVGVNLTIYDDGLMSSAMPETYEDTLPSVVPMNKDYDQGRLDGQSQPLPDCTPGVYTLPHAYLDDELVSGWLSLPWSSYATWTMAIPNELRVWRYDTSVWNYVLVQSGVSYSAATTGSSFELAIEGLAPSGVPPYLTVSCQKTDAEGSPLGLPVTDRVLVEVVSIDLEIAGISELDEETWAASMFVNDDYDETALDPYLAVSDNGYKHGNAIAIPQGIVLWDDDLTWASLTIDGPNGQAGKYWIEVVGEPLYNHTIAVWLADGSSVPRTREKAKLITLDAQAVDLLIEGLAKYDNEQNPIQLIAHFEPDGLYAKAGIQADVIDEALALVGVNKWTIGLPWDGERGEYIGTAVAGSYYDTLEQLAKNITGKAEDSFYLWTGEPIEPETEVFVDELLAVFEERLRENVVEAANYGSKRANFSGGQHNWLSSEANVNRIFGVGRSASVYPSGDCAWMVNVIMTRGVIMELLPDEFTNMGLAVGYFFYEEGGLGGFGEGRYFKMYDPPIARDALINGDWAELYNKSDYVLRSGSWAEEQVIKVAGNSYYGWGRPDALSHFFWKKELVDAYNKEKQPSAPITVDEIQGYDDRYLLNGVWLEPQNIHAGFIDISELAMDIFEYRKTKSF